MFKDCTSLDFVWSDTFLDLSSEDSADLAVLEKYKEVQILGLHLDRKSLEIKKKKLNVMESVVWIFVKLIICLLFMAFSIIAQFRPYDSKLSWKCLKNMWR